jgi:hypothetical protein
MAALPACDVHPGRGVEIGMGQRRASARLQVHDAIEADAGERPPPIRAADSAAAQ